MYIQ
jgi:hypothetical protein